MIPPRPTVAPLAAFSLPPRRTESLPGGGRATLIEAGTIPLASIRLVLRVGAVDAPADATWLERFTHDYLREGTERLDAAAFAGALAAMGGRLHVDVDEHTTTIGTEVLAEHAGAAAALLVELARTSRFPADALERLRADAHRTLDLANAQPGWLSHIAFRRALFGDQAYGRVSPEAATLDTFTTEGVRAFWSTNAGPNRAHLMVAGRFDADAVIEAARTGFEDWQPAVPPPALDITAHSERAVHLVDRPGAEQSTLQVGLPAIDPTVPDYVALEVTNALLGGAFSSRITMNIREAKGYTYSPRSTITAGPRIAYWAEAADVTTDVTGASLHEIFYEIDRLRSEAPSEAELSGLRNYVAGSFVIRQSSPSSLLDHLEFLDLHGLDASYSEAYLGRVQAVTPEEVQRIAVTYLRPEEMTIAVVGDRSRVEGQVAEYGPVRLVATSG